MKTKSTATILAFGILTIANLTYGQQSRGGQSRGNQNLNVRQVLVQQNQVQQFNNRINTNLNNSNIIILNNVNNSFDNVMSINQRNDDYRNYKAPSRGGTVQIKNTRNNNGNLNASNPVSQNNNQISQKVNPSKKIKRETPNLAVPKVEVNVPQPVFIQQKQEVKETRTVDIVLPKAEAPKKELNISNLNVEAPKLTMPKVEIKKENESVSIESSLDRSAVSVTSEKTKSSRHKVKAYSFKKKIVKPLSSWLQRTFCKTQKKGKLSVKCFQF